MICTGRNIFETRPVIEELKIPCDYAILNNGGHIINNKCETLYEEKISHDTGMKLIKEFIQYKDLTIMYSDGLRCEAYVNGKAYDHSVIPDVEIDPDFLGRADHSDGFQIICIYQNDQGFTTSKKLMDQINSIYSDELIAHQNQFYVDIVPKGCSKSTGIQTLLKLIKEKHKNIYSIGDSFNDLTMIKWADQGCTFDYAPKEIQEEADCVVHYVYEFIDMIKGDKI